MNSFQRGLLVAAHFLCPLIFFTNFTRNPYVTQIALLNGFIALAVAVWSWRLASSSRAAACPRLPIMLPMAAFVLLWVASWLQAYWGHVDFFKPSMLAEGGRAGIFLLANVLAACWLGALVSAEDDSSLDVPLGAWIAFVFIWGLAWTMFPTLRSRSPIRADDIWGQIWDPYGATVWLAGLAGAAWLCRRGRVIDYLHLAFATAFLASVYGICQYFNVEFFWPTVLNPYGGRAVSTFGNPNFLSTYVVALMPSALALFLTEAERHKRWVYGAIFLTLEAALLATLTRSSWGGAAIGIALLFASPKLRDRVRSAPRTVGFLLCAGVALALAWPSSTISAGYTPTFVGRLSELGQLTDARAVVPYSPWYQRILIWTCAWQMGAEFPLLGKGGGLFELFYPFYQGNILHEVAFYHTLRTHANNAHNEILEIFSQVGIAGLGAFILVWVSFFVSAARWARARAAEDYVWFGAVAGVAAVLVDNLLNVSLHFAIPAFIVWWQVGVAMGRGERGAGLGKSSPQPLGGRLVVSVLTATAAVAVLVWHVHAWEREAWYFAGFKLLRQGNMPGAIHALERSRSWGPREVNAIYELGNAYARSGRPQDAVDAYGGALNANAGYDEIYFNMATVYASQLGQFEKAGRLYETSWAINPLSPDVLNGLMSLYVRVPQDDKNKLVYLLQEATRLFPNNPHYWGNLGYALSLQSKWNASEIAYARALEIMPESAQLESNLRAVAARGGKSRIEILEDLSRLRAIEAALSRREAGAELLAHARQIVQRRPEFLKARFLLGSLLLTQGRPVDAAAEFEAVLARDRTRPGPYVNLGNCYLAMGKSLDAQTQYRAALAVDPNNATARERLTAMGVQP